MAAVSTWAITYGLNLLSGKLVVVMISMLAYSFFIGGLNNLVSSSCSADLAKASQQNGMQNGAATIMGIIQGIGTLGSSAGNLVVGFTLDLNTIKF
mgnify:CR=1 FL=1